MTQIDRRSFLRSVALTAGAFACPWTLRDAGAAETHPVLVVLFLRGAADGLNLVIPSLERARYEALRPTLAIPATQVLDYDSDFGLHPSLAPLQAVPEFGVVHAVGSPHGTRSHFVAMDYMERGAPGSTTGAGWLNAALRELGGADVLQAVGLGGPQLSLSGPAPMLAIDRLEGFRLQRAFADSRGEAILGLHAGSGGGLSSSVRRSLKVADRVASFARTTGRYPETDLGEALRDTASLIKANVGVKMVALDHGGWDTHSAEAERLTVQAGTLANALAAFWSDLSSVDRARTMVMAMTEFGRTAAQNGSGGTDHGHGSVMFALGGGVRGGRVHTRWPGLADGELYERRDLEVTTDFRDALAEVLQRHMGLSTAQIGRVFPGHSISTANFPGLLR